MQSSIGIPGFESLAVVVDDVTRELQGVVAQLAEFVAESRYQFATVFKAGRTV